MTCLDIDGAKELFSVLRTADERKARKKSGRGEGEGGVGGLGQIQGRENKLHINLMSAPWYSGRALRQPKSKGMSPYFIFLHFERNIVAELVDARESIVEGTDAFFTEGEVDQRHDFSK